MGFCKVASYSAPTQGWTAFIPIKNVKQLFHNSYFIIPWVLLCWFSQTTPSPLHRPGQPPPLNPCHLLPWILAQMNRTHRASTYWTPTDSTWTRRGCSPGPEWQQGAVPQSKSSSSWERTSSETHSVSSYTLVHILWELAWLKTDYREWQKEPVGSFPSHVLWSQHCSHVLAQPLGISSYWKDLGATSSLPGACVCCCYCCCCCCCF